MQCCRPLLALVHPMYHHYLLDLMNFLTTVFLIWIVMVCFFSKIQIAVIKQKVTNPTTKITATGGIGLIICVDVRRIFLRLLLFTRCSSVLSRIIFRAGSFLHCKARQRKKSEAHNRQQHVDALVCSACSTCVHWFDSR